jgi:hypothetical protein
VNVENIKNLNLKILYSKSFARIQIKDAEKKRWEVDLQSFLKDNDINQHSTKDECPLNVEVNDVGKFGVKVTMKDN